MNKEMNHIFTQAQEKEFKSRLLSKLFKIHQPAKIVSQLVSA